MITWIIVIAAFIIAVAHFINEEFYIRLTKEAFYHPSISFSAGVSITYVLLEMFPEFSIGVRAQGNYLFIFLLTGFVIVHLIEKYIYQHSSGKKTDDNLQLEGTVLSFIYHLVIGILMVSLFKMSFSDGMLFFIAVALHTSTNALPVDTTLHLGGRIIMASSTPLGALFAIVFIPMMTATAFYALMGLVTGALLFTVVRHNIPSTKESRPVFFIIGVVVYTLVILAI